MTESGGGPTVKMKVRVLRSSLKELIGHEFDLSGSEVWFGRGDENDVVLPDPVISGRHARLEVTEEGKFVLHDNDSSNGVIVGGQRVKEVELTDGKLFTLGTTILEFSAETAAEPEAPPAQPSGHHGTIFIKDFEELAREFETTRDFKELGQQSVTAANAPFMISDPTSMWLVESGKIEVFTIAVEAGEPIGSRSHFMTIEPGSVFFGLDADSAGYDAGFLAVGRAGSELRKYDVDRLQFYAPVPAHRKALAESVNGWVQNLSRRLTEDMRIPESDVPLIQGEEAELEPETVITSGKRLVWVELPAAHYLFDGMASMSYEVEGMLFPMAPGSWLEILSDEPIKVEPKSTEEVIADPRLWAGLEVFHRMLMECELLNKRLALVDEMDRLKRKAERADEAREAGMGAIASVLAGARKWETPIVGVTDLGPTFAAVQTVAATLGIDVQKPIGDLEGYTFEDTMHAVAAVSRFRIRKVTLVDDWFERDQGPLVGQLEEDQSPIAIVPTKPGSYDLIDPEKQERTEITEEVAATLAPFAYTLYRPFPDGVIGAKQLIKFIFQGLKREVREVLAMAITVGILGTITPMITGKVFDNAIPQAARGTLTQLFGALVLVSLATGAFKITQNVAMVRLQSRIDWAGQAAIWDRLLNLPTTFFRKYSAGDLADRASAVDKIRSIVAGAGVGAVLGSVASMFNAVQMLTYSAKLAAVAIGLTLLYVAMTTGCNYAKLRLERTEFARRGKITGLVLQLINGVSKLRVSGTEDHAFRTWATDFAGMRQTAFKVGRISNFMPVLNSGFTVISSLIIFMTYAKLQKSAFEAGENFSLSTGDFLAFNAAFGIFLGAMQGLGDASVGMLGIVPIFERVKPILEEPPEVDGTKATPLPLRGAIELSHVFFRYAEDAPWILKDMSLKIEEGEFVALVGGSGSGKSTLMKVMLGFEMPVRGGVYYDGQDLSTLDVRLVRQMIGVVLQESRLLPADIFRNIVGTGSRTIADAWDAATKAGLAEDIKRMPMGMHTYVSEGGGGFSGGQKQRLMIARALVHNPKILYLDEATSALDNRTQAIVTESMDRLQATRIVIAHRLSTVINADRICYLADGVVKEQGSYQELMDMDGLFAELARRQMA